MAKKRMKSKPRQSASDLAQPTILEVEQELMTGLLTQALALKILKNSSKPASELLKELMGIEVEVGRFIGNVLISGAEKTKINSYTGTLSGALSFVSRFNDNYKPSKKTSRR